MAARKRTAAVREGTRANDASTSDSESSGSFPRRGARSRVLSPTARRRQLPEKPSAFAYSATTARRRAAAAVRKALVDAYIKCLLTLNLCLLYPIAANVKLHRIGVAANARPNRIGVAANVRPNRIGVAANARPHRIGLVANVRPNRIGLVWKAPDYLQKATYRINVYINVDRNDALYCPNMALCVRLFKSRKE